MIDAVYASVTLSETITVTIITITHNESNDPNGNNASKRYAFYNWISGNGSNAM